MSARQEGVGGTRWMVVSAIALLAGGALALALTALLPGGGMGLRETFATAPLAVAGALLVPFAATWLGALAVRRAAVAGPVTAKAAEVAAPSASPAERGAAALQLLALLQQEGRFVDFIEEDLAPYSDQQIGTAVRSIHDGCRNALRDRIELRPILAEAEGATVTVERGFDPAAVRVTGNVRGEPPYRGVLRHPGWRSERVALPERSGDGDTTIVAPAEVEVL